MDLGPLIVELQKSFDLYGPQTAITVITTEGTHLSIAEVTVETDPSIGSSTTVVISVEAI